MFCLITSRKLSLQYFEFSLKVKVMRLNSGYLLKSFLLYIFFSHPLQIDQCMNTIIPIEELKLGLLQFDNLESLTPETNTRMVESALLKESSVLANTIAVMKKEGRDPDSVAKWLAHVNNRMIKAW